ncbi:hypothetical protein GGH99_007396, partial [Coemansia sp. RSA 1285]
CCGQTHLAKQESSFAQSWGFPTTSQPWLRSVHARRQQRLTWGPLTAQTFWSGLKRAIGATGCGESRPSFASEPDLARTTSF